MTSGFVFPNEQHVQLSRSLSHPPFLQYILTFHLHCAFANHSGAFGWITVVHVSAPSSPKFIHLCFSLGTKTSMLSASFGKKTIKPNDEDEGLEARPQHLRW